MLVTLGLILIAMWLVGLLGLFTIGTLVHAFLLVGLLLLLLAFAKARDVRTPPSRDTTPAP